MPPAASVSLPPRYVPYASDRPSGRSLTTNASGQAIDGGGPHWRPRSCAWRARRVGKSGDRVVPVTYAAPARSTATPPLVSPFVPPRYVEYASSRPLVESCATNASVGHGASETHRLRKWPWSAPRVGKSLESVLPVTTACPLRSTAMPTASSLRLPPR